MLFYVGAKTRTTFHWYTLDALVSSENNLIITHRPIYEKSYVTILHYLRTSRALTLSHNNGLLGPVNLNLENNCDIQTSISISLSPFNVRTFTFNICSRNSHFNSYTKHIVYFNEDSYQFVHFNTHFRRGIPIQWSSAVFQSHSSKPLPEVIDFDQTTTCTPYSFLALKSLNNFRQVSPAIFNSYRLVFFCC